MNKEMFEPKYCINHSAVDHYDGPYIRVVRVRDNAETDIDDVWKYQALNIHDDDFGKFRTLSKVRTDHRVDKIAIEAFSSGYDVYLKKVYDQGVFGQDWIFPGIYDCPKIVENGKVIEDEFGFISVSQKDWSKGFAFPMQNPHKQMRVGDPIRSGKSWGAITKINPALEYEMDDVTDVTYVYLDSIYNVVLSHRFQRWEILNES